MIGIKDKDWIRKKKVYLVNMKNALAERDKVNKVIRQIRKEDKALDNELLMGRVYG